MRRHATACGLPVDEYVERLITSGEFDEIQSALSESLEQIERGEDRPAREVFAELRVRYGRAETA